MSDHVPLNLTVNGEPVALEVEPRTTAADMLRNQLGLTGTHLGCEQGACGACTVLVDGEPVRSCLVFAFQLEDSQVETVEGLEEDGTLDPVQTAFLDHRGFQCGFCTPGMMLMLRSITEPVDREGLEERICGHICRCTGYHAILRSGEAYLRDRGLFDEEPRG